MKVYALKGHGERGKSTTLKKLIVNILDKFPSANIMYGYSAFNKHQILGEINDERVLRRNTGAHCGVENIMVVIEISGKIIGINTAGDSRWQVQDSMNLFSAYQCDIGFCACRSKGETGKILEQAYMPNMEYVYKAEIRNAGSYKNFDDWLDLLNDWQADELLQKI